MNHKAQGIIVSIKTRMNCFQSALNRIIVFLDVAICLKMAVIFVDENVFKLMKKSSSEEKTVVRVERSNMKITEETNVKLQPVKSSFLIDNLLANDTNTNTSYSTTSSSPTSELNSPFQHLLFQNDFDLVRKLSFFSDMNNQHQQHQQHHIQAHQQTDFLVKKKETKEICQVDTSSILSIRTSYASFVSNDLMFSLLLF